MRQYRLVDNILGWVAFAIAAFTYCSTIEPTASFWDCPEFITTGYKLEIGHPPGAPFFMLMANFFTHFASDPTQVARMVNLMSALLSATCILFLYWSVTHLARRLVLKDWSELTTGKLIAIEASGMVGALIYTWSDTFWFSAVEGEVYAFSSAITAVVFWLILKWEDHADEPGSDRWLILIAYMTGLGVGVHLLCLLCLPAIVLVYYYKKVPNANAKGSILALVISFVIVYAVLYGVVPGIVKVGGWFELFFVNTLGMPFNTGEIVYIILLIASVLWAIWETYKAKERPRDTKRENAAFLLAVAMLGIPFQGNGWTQLLSGAVILFLLWLALGWRLKREQKLVPLVTTRIKNTTLLCLLMIMIGYSSYALIVIRSSANPPMDQNSPEDIFTLGSYLSRDQYGDTPLLYGPAYTSQVALEVEGNMCKPKLKEGAPIYARKEKASPDEKDSYFVVDHKSQYVYAQNMLFPRMHSSEDAAGYESWMGGVEGNSVPFDRCGEPITVKMPTQWDNLRYFLSYQCNFMYWRYFMWNFAGRQNDIQGNGEPEHGNWITGISFIDNAMLGDQSKLPDDLKSNKGHNVFYCLPLLLGVIGLFWQAYHGKRGIQQFWVVFFLFFMTGLAIVLYVNQPPMQPRERDYSYAGSFYAFAIWCGLGVLAIVDLLSRKLKSSSLAIPVAVAIVALLVPIQMVSQTWDDHDRSGRYICHDMGQDYLSSLQEGSHPIIFTYGDNDTFPLWYNQEVEGFGTDARVCNLSYLSTDWYIDQMCRPAYDSPSVPISWPRLDYCSGTNEYVLVQPDLKEQVKELYREHPREAARQFGAKPFELKNILRYWVRSRDENMHVIPTDTVYVTIDKEAVKKSGMMMAADSIPDKMVISLKGKSVLYKNDLMMLEIIAQSNWTRPVYVATTVGSKNYMNLGDNFVQEGLACRITPFTTNAPGAKSFDVDRTYHNVMTRFKFGNLKQRGIYIDDTNMSSCYTLRQLMSLLALELIKEGEDDKALKVLRKAEVEIPGYNVPINYLSGGVSMARAYALLGKKDKAKEYLRKCFNYSSQYLDWYLSLNDNWFAQSTHECLTHLYILRAIQDVADITDSKLGKEYQRQTENYYRRYIARGGQLPQE